MKKDREEAAKNVPLLFVASPSAKDPTWEARSPGTESQNLNSIDYFILFFSKTVSFFFFTLGKSTLSLVTFVKYEWFEEWKDGKVTNRGRDYTELKQAFIDTILEVVMDVFPKITRDKVKTLPM